MVRLPENKMPEPEVSLRLAFYLVSNRLSSSNVRVSIDGAHVRTKDTIHFPIIEFLKANGWSAAVGQSSFQGFYSHPAFGSKIEIDSIPGRGDLVATLMTGKKIRVESKKGPLVQSRNSAEYVRIHEALGQLLTVAETDENDLLAVAVPSSPKFEKLAGQWRAAPLIRKLGIAILTVSRDGQVSGLASSID